MRYVFILIALISVALAALSVWMLAQAPQPLDARIVQATIAGALVGIGWSVTFLTQEHRRWREREDLRTEIQMALRAEISDFAARIVYADSDNYGASIEARIRAGGDGKDGAFHVFIPRTRHRSIFETLGDRVRHIGPGCVDHVVWLYSQLADVEAFEVDLNSAAYRRMPAARRADAYRHYIQMLSEAKRRADQAILALTDALGDRQDDETELEVAALSRRQQRKAELRAWLNSRAAAPDGR